jgi:hypothetical protein
LKNGFFNSNFASPNESSLWDGEKYLIFAALLLRCADSIVFCEGKKSAAVRDENGRERSGKPLNHSRNYIF